MGIDFDHKQEYQRAWRYYAIAHFILLIWTIIYYAFLNKYPLIDLNEMQKLIMAFAVDLLQSTGSITILIAFTILLNHIRRRFILLNGFLRSFIYVSIIRLF